MIRAALAGALACGLGCEQLIGADFGDKRLACARNAECAGSSICDKSSGRCVELTSDLCTRLHGGWRDDDALLIGSVFPTTTKDDPTGLVIENAITLAIDDFLSAGNLPGPDGTRRPIGLVGCDDQGDDALTIEAAKHLAIDLKLPAIVGAYSSTGTTLVNSEVTKQAGTLLFSPSATAVSITDLDDDGLLWRTAPSDIFQAAALALYIPQVEAKVRAALQLTASDAVKVLVVNRNDTYGQLANALEMQLFINGKPALQNGGNYKRLAYDVPVSSKTVKDVLDFAPHILVIIGLAEGLTDIYVPVEGMWSGAPAPQIVFTDGGELPDLWTKYATTESARLRVTGTAPGTTGPLFDEFTQAYSAHPSLQGSPALFGVAGAYDIVYLLGYSAATLDPRAAITGPELVKGFARLTPPLGTVEVRVGDTQITTALKDLTMGPINYTGASGPLDFDLTTGEAPSDIQIWCLPGMSPGMSPDARPSGLYLDAKSKTLAGMFSACP